MNTLQRSILLLSLAALVVGCQKGGDAVDETSGQTPSSSAASQSAGVSGEHSSDKEEPEESEELLSKGPYVEAYVKIECAKEKLGSEVKPSVLRARTLKELGVPELAFERAADEYGDDEEMNTSIRKRLSRWCTEERARRALGMDSETE